MTARRRAALRPRHPGDLRALLWLALAAAVAATSWCWPAARPYLWPVGAYFSLAAGLIAHGHNHCPMFTHRSLNQAVNVVTTVFFGFPTFVWVAGHNLLHHRFSNARGDPSATWHLTRRHNLLTAIVCPLYAMLYEPVVVTFLRDTWRTNRRRFRACLLQIAVLVGGTAVGLAADATAFFWAFGLPALVGLYLIHYFNYVQHVHCDPFSELAHSRDWTGRVLNFLLFNQGFHTVHHNRPGVHWSRWREMHDQVRDHIPAELQSDNLLVWLVRVYLLAPFSPRHGTRQVGTAPWERLDGAAHTLHTPSASGDSL